MKKTLVKLFAFALVLSFFAPVCGVAAAAPASEILFYSGNDYAVISGPQYYAEFIANKTLVVTSITTYHYHGNGGAPGTIELLDTTGKSYGHWQATGRDGHGIRNLYWDVNVNVVLPAGHTYRVKDSNLATWSHNEQSGGRGFAWVMGYVKDEVVAPEPGGTQFPVTNGYDHSKRRLLQWQSLGSVDGVVLRVAAARGRDGRLLLYWSAINNNAYEVDVISSNRRYKTSAGDMSGGSGFGWRLKASEESEPKHVVLNDSLPDRDAKLKVYSAQCDISVQKIGAAPAPAPEPDKAAKGNRISGVFRITLVSDSTGKALDSNYRTVIIGDDGNKITSNYYTITSYNRQTGELRAIGEADGGERPSDVRLKFTISGSSITAVGTITFYFTGNSAATYNVKLVKIANTNI